MAAVIRSALLLAILLVGIALAITHGVRGFIALVFLVLLLTVPRTRVYRVGEAWLVRLTGSRRRAGVAVGLAIIAAVLVFEVVELTR